MKTIYGLLGISLLLFITSIWFVVLGVRGPARPPQAEPVASVKQLMTGIITPASTVVYSSVSTLVTAAGVEETYPRNDDEWERVGANALALAEAGNLLMVEGRAVDNGAWMRIAQDMVDAAKVSYNATVKKDTEALLASGETLNNSCDACHREYNADVE